MHLQVKEACRKASEAELVAKNRLLQMNCKLDIQSRIMVQSPYISNICFFHLKLYVLFNVKPLKIKFA